MTADDRITVRHYPELAPAERGLVSPGLAVRLRTAGLEWQPRLHDLFMVPGRDLDDRVFAISDMTIDLEYFAGHSTIMFNGAVEWSLDSIVRDDVVWLPTESQLRALLADRFESLVRNDGVYRCTIRFGDEPRTFDHAEPAEAYGLALLAVLGEG